MIYCSAGTYCSFEEAMKNNGEGMSLPEEGKKGGEKYKLPDCLIVIRHNSLYVFYMYYFAYSPEQSY